MKTAVNRFNPVQDPPGETARRPISKIGVLPQEQWSPDDPLVPYEVIVPHQVALRAWVESSMRAVTEGTESTRAASQTFGSRASAALPVLRAVRRLPPFSRPRERFIVLQQWEGTVLSTSDEEFTAVMRDLTNPSRPDEEMTLPIDEVPESDRRLLVSGAVFYWSLGYKETLSGQRERVAALRFRRLPVWTSSDLRDLQRKADEFAKLFGRSTPATGS